jgi:hypothetical protein
MTTRNNQMEKKLSWYRTIWLIIVDIFLAFVRPFKKAKELSERADFLYGIKVFLVTSIPIVLFFYYIGMSAPYHEPSAQIYHLDTTWLDAEGVLIGYLLYYSPSIFETFCISLLVYALSRLIKGELNLWRVFGTLSVVVTGSYILPWVFLLVIRLFYVIPPILNLFLIEVGISLIRLTYVFIFVRTLTKRFSHATISAIALLVIEIPILLFKLIMYGIAASS